MEEEIIRNEVLKYCAQLGVNEETFDILNQDGILTNLFKIGVQVGMQTMYQQMACLPNTPNVEEPKVETPRKNVTYEEREDGSKVKVTDCGGGWKVYQVI